MMIEPRIAFNRSLAHFCIEKNRIIGLYIANKFWEGRANNFLISKICSFYPICVPISGMVAFVSGLIFEAKVTITPMLLQDIFMIIVCVSQVPTFGLSVRKLFGQLRQC